MSIKLNTWLVIWMSVQFLSLSTLASEGNYKPFQCAGSSAPLFREGSSTTPITLTLKADFGKINSYDHVDGDEQLAKSEGTLSYSHPRTNQLINIKALFKARGSYRFEECSNRPLKFIISAEEKQRLNNQFNDHLFKGNGKKLKLVTACHLGAEYEEEQQKLLKEFYLYQVLDTLSTPGLKTRLVKLKYLDPTGYMIGESWGFLREPEKKMVKRCGFIKEPKTIRFRRNDQNQRVRYVYNEAGELVPYYPKFNATSLFQIHLLNHLIRNTDYMIKHSHNVIRMMHPVTKELYLAGYDYDLSAVVGPGDHWPPENFDKSVDRFRDWVLKVKTDSSLWQVQLQSLLDQRPKMEKVLENSFLASDFKKEMSDWLYHYLETLDRLLSSER